ncbi:MAG: magnesium transporter [Bacteroidales bacterium]|nr:magnesium transporter [Bacteroidales bacterium]MBD5205476.1 magnesium transporter [Bacteroidales bacterium]MBD5223153.1 magnesium transporter [Bacteroidales bacterium]MBD5302449.1 magnesium transporter [Bacteroides sp.]MBD5348365.1 magnesium transporter [Bacteroides sp.]
MKDFTHEDIDRLKHLIDEEDKTAVLHDIDEMHPADIAELFQDLNLKQAEWFFELIPDKEKKADVLMELDEEDRKKLLEGMAPEQIGHFIDLLDTDDAVDLIQELDEEDREEVIQNIEDMEQAGDIVDLLQYDEDTAGGLMGTEFISVNENLSMPDCLREMRHQAEDLDDIYYVYVVDDENRLKGILPLKKMITHPSVSKIKHVMETDPVAVKADMPIEEVAIDFEKYDLVAMPVIDSIGRLVGQITVDDVMDQVREQSERDYQLASGISSDIDADDSIFAQTKARLPWLLIGIIGGIVNSLILGGFEAQIAAVTALAFFIPLIGGTGGNVGVQASAIVVQGLANGRLELSDFWNQIWRGVRIALLNAIVISGVVFAYISLTQPGDYALVMAVSVSLFAVVIFATVFGTLVPLTLEKLKVNPALATGPFIQITNDVVGLLIYVGMSVWMLKIFPH